MIAKDDNTQGKLPDGNLDLSEWEGEFRTASLYFTTGSDLLVDNPYFDRDVAPNPDTNPLSIDLMGMVLGIRLVHKNALRLGSIDDWASEVAFDEVQLSVSVVPVPAAVWLFGTALIGLFGFGKRKKAA